MGTTHGPAKDMVNHPPHYKAGGMEAIDVIEAFAPGNYHRGNALKYLLRAGKKGDLAQDLHKAIWYIKREIDNLPTEPAPLNPRIEEHLTKIETEGKFAHACPDLDQEYPLRPQFDHCIPTGMDCACGSTDATCHSRRLRARRIHGSYDVV